MMLAIVTILLGLLIALTRLPGAVKPELARRMASAVLGSMPVARMVGGVALVFSALLFIGIKHADADFEIIMKVFAVALAVGGVVFALGATGLRRAVLLWIEQMPDLALRALCLLGGLIGLALMVLGFIVYMPE